MAQQVRKTKKEGMLSRGILLTRLPPLTQLEIPHPGCNERRLHRFLSSYFTPTKSIFEPVNSTAFSSCFSVVIVEDHMDRRSLRTMLQRVIEYMTRTMAEKLLALEAKVYGLAGCK